MRRGLLRDLLTLVLVLGAIYVGLLLMLYAYGRVPSFFSQNILVRTMVEKHRTAVRWFQE